MGLGVAGPSCVCQGGDVSHLSARRDLSAIRLGTRVAGGRSRRVRRTVSSSGTVTLVGRFMSAMLSTGFAPGTVTGPTPRLPRRFPTRHQSSQSGPIDHPRVVGTRGKFPTFPGRLPRPQEVTRWVRGGRYRARGQRRVPHSDLRVASWPTERHGRAARALAGGSPTFSEIKTR